jgi:hypothetical protein
MTIKNTIRRGDGVGLDDEKGGQQSKQTSKDRNDFRHPHDNHYDDSVVGRQQQRQRQQQQQRRLGDEVDPSVKDLVEQEVNDAFHNQQQQQQQDQDQQSQTHGDDTATEAAPTDPPASSSPPPADAPVEVAPPPSDAPVDGNAAQPTDPPQQESQPTTDPPVETNPTDPPVEPPTDPPQEPPTDVPVPAPTDPPQEPPTEPPIPSPTHDAPVPLPVPTDPPIPSLPTEAPQPVPTNKPTSLFPTSSSSSGSEIQPCHEYSVGTVDHFACTLGIPAVGLYGLLVFLPLLLVCCCYRYCCCRKSTPSASDTRGEYRAIAATYGDASFGDNAFSADLSDDDDDDHDDDHFDNEYDDSWATSGNNKRVLEMGTLGKQQRNGRRNGGSSLIREVNG